MIDDPEVREKIQSAFSEVKTLYIADGHHRAASAARVAKLRREAEKQSAGTECPENVLPEYEYFLAVLFADSELLVMDYNRWVKDLAGMGTNEFLDVLRKKFSLYPAESAIHPDHKGQFTMYLDHQWYRLEEKEMTERNDVVENLDVSVLQEEILHPILKIEDPKTDRRIAFAGGIRGLGELERLVDQSGGVAFAMYPTSLEELFAVADAGKLMPPKSTWFEPKLRSGLLIHLIS